MSRTTMPATREALAEIADPAHGYYAHHSSAASYALKAIDERDELRASLSASREREAQLEAQLRRIALGSRRDSRTCDWCGTDIGDCTETPGHKADCPVAIARAALSGATQGADNG